MLSRFGTWISIVKHFLLLLLFPCDSWILIADYFFLSICENHKRRFQFILNSDFSLLVSEIPIKKKQNHLLSRVFRWTLLTTLKQLIIHSLQQHGRVDYHSVYTIENILCIFWQQEIENGNDIIIINQPIWRYIIRLNIKFSRWPSGSERPIYNMTNLIL